MPPATSISPGIAIRVVHLSALLMGCDLAVAAPSPAERRDRARVHTSEPRMVTQEDRRRRAEALRRLGAPEGALSAADAKRERRMARNLAAVAAGAMVAA